MPTETRSFYEKTIGKEIIDIFHDVNGSIEENESSSDIHKNAPDFHARFEFCICSVHVQLSQSIRYRCREHCSKSQKR
jgi:hypothetical protein